MILFSYHCCHLILSYGSNERYPFTKFSYPFGARIPTCRLYVNFSHLPCIFVHNFSLFSHSPQLFRDPPAAITEARIKNQN